MARTETIRKALGYTAPDFELRDTISGAPRTLSDIRGSKGTVVMFICNHCPFVVHVIHELVAIAKEPRYAEIGFVAISSNDITSHPQDGPEQMRLFAIENGFPFPYLFDATQEVAKAYTAACTPDLSVFDSTLKCVYRGQLDGSRPGNGIPVTGVDLRKVLDALLTGSPIPAEQRPSVGCNIKWKGGIAPDHTL